MSGRPEFAQSAAAAIGGDAGPAGPAEDPGGPRLLFVPVSGPGGAGEYFRSVAVARAVARRWPDSQISFIVSRDASYARHAPFPVTLIDRSPTFESAAVESIIRRQKPQVVIFDSAGRVSQYRAARQVGARVVFVSSRPSSRRKGFKLRRMRWFDQHWIAQPRFLGGELTRREQLKCRLAQGVEIVPLEVLFEPVEEGGTLALLGRFGLQTDSYILLCPGGGGVFGDARDPAEIFFRGACALAASTPWPVIAVLGQRFKPPQPVPPGVHVLAEVTNGVLMGLLGRARCSALNGGSLLVQAIARQAPCTAAPIAGDQPPRIERCAELGLVVPTTLDAGALAESTSRLATDDTERAAMRARLAALALGNGLDVAIEAVGRLLPLRLPKPAARCDGPDRPLRLMHVILSSGFAGSERAVAEFCSATVSEHDVAVVLRRDHRSPGGASIRDQLADAVEVIEVPPLLGTRSALEEAVKRWQPDVVHTHLRRGTRYVSQMSAPTIHFCTLHLSLNGPHFLYSDGLVCISHWQEQTLPADYAGEVFLIPNSLVPQPRIDDARRRELRSQLGAGDDDFLVGGVGRLTPSKGFDVLIRAFRQAGLPGAKLAIVGEGRSRPALERLGAGEVVFAGYRNDAKDCFQAFDLFVCPSRYEPFGRVIVEALDGGVPVIATDALGPSDIARRYPIKLVPVGDVSALATALRHAFESSPQRIDVDLSEFHIDRVVERTLQAYRRLLREERPLKAG